MPAETHRMQPVLRVCLAALLTCLVPTAYAEDDELELERLPNEQCIDTILQARDELATENQRYWFARVPPYVGYKKGERTTAGGDGTCYLGFPNAKSKSAVILVDGQVVQIVPQSQATERTVTKYKSKDGLTSVEVKVTGRESTCVPDEGKCCGEYTYATIKVIQGKRSTSVRAARYEGS